MSFTSACLTFRKVMFPYWANCEACNRSRGLTPARMRGDRPEKEYQVDQFMYRSRCFIILVHVLAFAVAVTFRPEGMSGREASTYLEPWLAHFGLSQHGNTKPSFYCDPEPLTINIAQALAERYGDTVKVLLRSVMLQLLSGQ